MAGSPAARHRLDTLAAITHKKTRFPIFGNAPVGAMTPHGAVDGVRELTEFEKGLIRAVTLKEASAPRPVVSSRPQPRVTATVTASPSGRLPVPTRAAG